MKYTYRYRQCPGKARISRIESVVSAMTAPGALFMFLFLTLYTLSQLFLPGTKAKNTAMLVFTLVFYLWADILSIPILLGLGLICWVSPLLMRRRPAQKKIILGLTIALCLTVLVIFKYLHLLLSGLRLVSGVPETLPGILVPVGISIYTLHMISYVVDVYRGEAAMEPSYPLLLTYCGLFHRCMAGPVVRYQDAIPHLKARRITLPNVSRGISRISIGLVKLLLLADSLAVSVDALLVRSADGLNAAPALAIFLGVLLSALRLSLTFSAFSDLAIGLGLLCGFRDPENFDTPLLSNGLGDFISRWFITVTSFFQEYVLRPITAGGSRRLLLGQTVSLLLLGLWFGGSLNFLLLGLFLAVAVPLESRLFRRGASVPRGVFGAICGFVFFFLFTFTTPQRLLTALKGLVCQNGNAFFRAEALSGLPGCIPLILVCLLFSLPLGRLVHNLYYSRFKTNRTAMTLAFLWETVYPIVLIVLTALFLLLGGGKPFLTF